MVMFNLFATRERLDLRFKRERFRSRENPQLLYLGRGTSFPLALGALQLKEISYIHAEGYAAGDLKNCGRQICQVVQRQIPRARDNELVHNLLDWLPKWTTMVERRRQEGVTEKVFTGSGQSHPRRVKPQRDFE